jgi:hypothetical protein
MSKSNATEQDVLKSLLNKTTYPWDAATTLDINLHTADPGEGGTTATALATYTNYAPVTINRNATDLPVTSPSGVSQAKNASLIQFPQCGVTGNTITHVSICPTGSTQILYSGPLNSALAVANLIQPQFSPNALVVTED